MADLQDRMSKTVLGQVTWANPDLGKKCFQCKHIKVHPKPSSDGRKMHQCALVKVHMRKPGVPFDGNNAIACSMFSQ